MADIPYYNEVKPGQIFPPSKTITNFTVALVNDLITKLNLNFTDLDADVVSLQDQITAIIGMIGAPGFGIFETATSVEAATIAGTVEFLTISGYVSAGDGGAALYKSVVAEPAHAGKLQSADGGWWELAATQLNPKQFGAVGDGVANDQTAVEGAVALALSLGADLYWLPGTYLTTASIADFHSVNHFGPGVIARGSDSWHITPTISDTNTIYVSAAGTTGNDGFSSSQPTTIPQAAVIVGLKDELRGTWVVQLAAGTYTTVSVFEDVNTVKDSSLTIQGPAVTHNTNPTAIVDGNAAASNGMTIINCRGTINIKNIEFREWGDPAGAGVDEFKAGLTIATSSVVYLTNVWATNCGTGWYVRSRSFYFFTGGKIDGCYYAILELFSVVRSSTGVASLADGLTLSNNRVGLFAKEHCTGHLDWTTVEDNIYGIYLNRSATANISDSNFERNSYAITLRTGSFAGGTGFTFGSGVDENTTAIWNVDHASGSIINEANVTFDEFHAQGLRQIDHHIPNSSGTSHTGTTSPTTVVTFGRDLLRGTMMQPGHYVKCTVFGTKIGSAGTVTLDLRLNTGTSATCDINAASTVWRAEMYIYPRGPSDQLCVGQVHGLTTTNDININNRTIALEDFDFTVSLRVTLGSAADTITIFSAILETTNALIIDS